jgi:hypothetical protein
VRDGGAERRNINAGAVYTTAAYVKKECVEINLSIQVHLLKGVR